MTVDFASGKDGIFIGKSWFTLSAAKISGCPEWDFRFHDDMFPMINYRPRDESIVNAGVSGNDLEFSENKMEGQDQPLTAFQNRMRAPGNSVLERASGPRDRCRELKLLENGLGLVCSSCFQWVECLLRTPLFVFLLIPRHLIDILFLFYIILSFAFVRQGHVGHFTVNIFQSYARSDIKLCRIFQKIIALISIHFFVNAQRVNSRLFKYFKPVVLCDSSIIHVIWCILQ